MLRITIIVFILCISGYSIAQKKSYFVKTDFDHIELDDQFIVVKYRPGSIPNGRTSFNGIRKSTSPTYSSILDGLVKVPLKKGQHPLDLCNQYLADPNVLYAEPIVLDQPLYAPSDPLISNQYYLTNINARAAWDITTGDDDITIGIIDTGIDMDHEDLLANIWTNENDPIDGIDNDGNGYIDDYYGYDFADGDSNPDADQSAHGVRVAGVAGANTNNGMGIAGVGFNTKIAALKGFRSSNGLSNGLFDAILYAAENGIQILNLSWGSIRQPLQSEQDIINYAVIEKNMVIVAAAGNDGNKSTAQEKFYPASYENVLSVGGSDASDNKWSGSSYNYAVDLVAPASSILSTISGNGYNSSGGFGTSFAAPMVAATAALVKDRFPTLTGQQIMERVRRTADDIYSIGNNGLYDGKLGTGRLNAYRAVSETGVKSMRIEPPNVQSKFAPVAFYGDTIQVTARLTNYLGNSYDPVIYASSPDNQFTPVDGSIFPGFMSTLEQKEISFDIVLSENLPPSTEVTIRLDFTDEGYSDFQYINFTTAPNYFDFGNNSTFMTIVGNGDLGLVEYGSDEQGTGLIHQNEQLLKFTGILMATSASSFSDNIINNYSTLDRGNGFINRKNFKLFSHPGADLYGYSEFIDPKHNLIIEQSAISWQRDDFIIIRYRIVNNNATTLNNLSFGVFTDWDLGDPSTNYAAFDTNAQYLFTRNQEANLFAATKVLGNGTLKYSALDRSDLNGNSQDVFDDFSSTIKYDFLINQNHVEAGNLGVGNDVAGIHGITLDEIPAYGSSFINLIYAVSDFKQGLDIQINEAENKLSQFILKPRILESFYTCDGVAVTLAPTSGTSFNFYQDPLGLMLLSSGSSFNPGVITKDTTFYVQVLDENYPSDIFAIQLKLLNEIANFELSTDTLYLDHPTLNTVQFTDMSRNPVSWQWDFGQGAKSTLQHPTMVFNEVGDYTIQLTIENEQGCTDTIQKTLYVRARPEIPTFPNYTICPEASFLLSNAAFDDLKVFASGESNHPILTGNELLIGPVKNDSIIYVSGIINGLESQRVPVPITTYKFKKDFQILPDTLSIEHQLRVFSNVDATSTIEWIVNGSSFGNNQEIIVPANEGSNTIKLIVNTLDGCSLTVTKAFSVSSSPFAMAKDQVGCEGETVIIKPSNGTYFGFYRDNLLTDFISKGTQLVVDESQKLYVVGLDDGLPGLPIEVDVSMDSFDFTINHKTSRVGTKNRVELSVSSNDNIASYHWYVAEELVATSPTAILFLDDTQATIRLEATNANGCISSDVLEFDFTPPLGISDNSSFSIYPNPTTDFIRIDTKEMIHSILITDMTGKLLELPPIKNERIDIRKLGPGLYMIEFTMNLKSYKVKFIVQ